MTQHTLDPVQLFQGFARDGFRLRDPVIDTTGLRRSFAVGSCLEPLIFAGDELFIDESACPEHGDLVWFEWPAETVAQWRESERSAQWTKRWGSHDFTRGLKLLWEFTRGFPDFVPKEFYLLTNEDMTRVGTHKFLGVVRAIVRNGVMLTTLGLAACDNVAPYAQPGAEIPVACTSIDPNAATQLVINNNNGAGSGITGITGLSSLGIVASNSGPAVNCTVIVTATIQARQTVGTLGDVKLLVRYADDGVTLVSSAQELKIVSASFQTYTIQWQFSHSAANRGVAGQASIWSDSGSTSDSYDWQLATLSMEYVLR